MPMSLLLMAFSISLRLALSKGEIMSVLASGTAMDASCFKGVSAP
jgi:hypothetical protein